MWFRDGVDLNAEGQVTALPSKSIGSWRFPGIVYVKPAHNVISISLLQTLCQRPRPATVTASASPPLTAKIDLLLPGATTDKVALTTSGVICDALLIGSISSQLYNL